VHTTAHLAAGDVRARYSLAGETRDLNPCELQINLTAGAVTQA
jgi:hypothetical protein